MLDLGTGLVESIRVWRIVSLVIDSEWRDLRFSVLLFHRQCHRRHAAVAAVGGEVAVVAAAGREQRDEQLIVVVVYAAEAFVDLFVPADQRIAADAVEERLRL